MQINLYKFNRNPTIKVYKLVDLNTKRIQFKEFSDNLSALTGP